MQSDGIEFWRCLLFNKGGEDPWKGGVISIASEFTTNLLESIYRPVCSSYDSEQLI
jgi:hypothetical protein